MMKLNVLYQFNEKYAPYAGVSMTSLFINNTQFRTIDVYILGEELSRESINKFEVLAKKFQRSITFIDAKDIIELMKQWGLPSYRGSWAANIRLFCPLFLEKNVGKILYLDADTIVNSSLEKLINIEMGNAALAMVLDSLGHNHKIKIGMSEDEYYYNSGVILFEMDKWIKNDLSNKIKEYVIKNGCFFSSPDQDLLNVVCKDYIKTLSPVYNMQPIHVAFSINDFYNCYCPKGYYRREEIAKAVKDVCIYHTFRFLGEFPWHKKNLHPNNEIFDKYIKLSPWNEYVKKNADVPYAIKIEKILYKTLPKRSFIKLFSFFHSRYVEKAIEIKK